jgi:xanthine dehydrogenase accessory factor
VLRAPCDGIFYSDSKIGDLVSAGQQIGSVAGEKVVTKLNGAVRGLIYSGLTVRKGLKIGDVDPRGVLEYCFSISEKSRAIGGSVLEAILRRYN